MFSGKIPSPFNVYRSIGTLRTERYGIGVMDKTGCSSDYTNRAHPEYVIVLVLRGWGLYIDSSGTEYPLHPGSCFQRFAGVPHTTRIEPDSGWVECFLQLGETMAALLENCAVAERERPVLTTAITPGVLERIRALRDSFLNAADAELIHQLPEILELAQLLLSGESPKSGDERKKLLEQACAYLGGNFRRNDDLRGFCRRHGCGYENFRKIFKEELGISPHRYRIRRRLDAACALLNDPTLSIASIAERLGYSSPYEFSAQFKRHMGCAPSAYLPRFKN